MFTSIAVNSENIIRARLRPPVIVRVPIGAELVVRRAGKDIFVTSPVPAISSSRRVMKTGLSHDTRARVLAASGDERPGSRVLVSGTLGVAASFERPDGLVGFIQLELPFSTNIELPGVAYWGIMRAAAEVSFAPAWWDGPLGTTFGCLIRVRVVVTREETIVVFAVFPPGQVLSVSPSRPAPSKTVTPQAAPFRHHSE